MITTMLTTLMYNKLLSIHVVNCTTGKTHIFHTVSWLIVSQSMYYTSIKKRQILSTQNSKLCFHTKNTLLHSYLLILDNSVRMSVC